MPPGSPPTKEVAPPAIALMVVAIIALVAGVLGLLGDVVLILTGALARLEAVNDGPMSEYAQVAVRTLWGIVLLCVAGFVLYGSIQMKQLKKYNLAKAAAIVAVIPCLSPCCLLGIPFGIWAIIVLNKPAVRSAFTS